MSTIPLGLSANPQILLCNNGVGTNAHGFERVDHAEVVVAEKLLSSVSTSKHRPPLVSTHLEYCFMQFC